MRLVSIGKEYRLLRFPTSIKNGVCEYFTYGKGYKKTRKFQVLDIDMPDRWEKLSWLQLCRIHEKYGIGVSNEYAECKVAGMISRQTMNGKYTFYEKIKDIIPENFDDFFELLPCEFGLSLFGMYLFDIVKFDRILSKMDPEYSDIDCTYKGEKCSMKEYVGKKYGENYVNIIEKLI